MYWRSAAFTVSLTSLVVATADAAGEGRSSERSRPFSVQFAAGSHVRGGGDSQSLSFGYAPWRAFTLLVNVERDHVPSRTHADPGRFSATRGGTLMWMSGEVRYTLPLGDRTSPFVLAGRGAGISHPNVNDVFRDRVTNTGQVFYFGGGMRVRLRPSLEVIVDARAVLVAERDSLLPVLPIRAGATWRF